MMCVYKCVQIVTVCECSNEPLHGFVKLKGLCGLTLPVVFLPSPICPFWAVLIPLSDSGSPTYPHFDSIPWFPVSSA